MSEFVEVTAEMDARVVDAPEFADSSQSVDLLLASVKPPRPEATLMRLLAFKPEGPVERLALVFVGPEAEQLSLAFVQYAEALFDAIEAKRGTQE